MDINICRIAVILLTVDLTVVHSFIHTEREVVGWKDESVRLPCVFSGRAVALFWAKLLNTSDPMGQPDNKARYYDDQFTSIDPRFTLDEIDFSLTITKLRVADEGVYQCHVEDDQSNDEKNTTQITVFANASSHLIKQCEDQSGGGGHCSLPASHKFPRFNLDCTVSGFKPNVSVIWRDAAGVAEAPVVPPVQQALEDGTWELTVTINVGAKNGSSQNFTCEAERKTPYPWRSLRKVTVLPLPGPSPSPTPASQRGIPAVGKFFLAIFIIILILAIILGLLILADRKGRLPTQVSSVIQMIPLLKKEKKLTPAEEEERRLLDERENKKSKRSELREKITSYLAGDAANIELPAALYDTRPNINMFGQMSAGKSTFLNSLNYALTGEFKVVFEVGGKETGGGKTRERLQLQIKDTHFNLVDNRGMASFSLDFMDDVMRQIRGESGVNPEDAILRQDTEECHCPIFVYHDSFVTSESRREAFAFIDKFVQELHGYYGRSPMIIITHKGEIQGRAENELQDIKDRMKTYGIPEDKIWAFESYTKDNQEEDIDKDIELLDFLWQSLDACDRNMSHISRKKNQTVVDKPKQRKEDRKKKEKAQQGYTSVTIPTPPKESESKGSGCSVM